MTSNRIKEQRDEVGFLVVERREDIPAFSSEEEEHRFWSTHTLGEALLDELKPVPLEGDGILPPARSSGRPISLRLESDVLRRLRALAARKHVGYQTLLKTFVAERLYEEEKREGLV